MKLTRDVALTLFLPVLVCSDPQAIPNTEPVKHIGPGGLHPWAGHHSRPFYGGGGGFGYPGYGYGGGYMPGYGYGGGYMPGYGYGGDYMPGYGGGIGDGMGYGDGYMPGYGGGIGGGGGMLQPGDPSCTMPGAGNPMMPQPNNPMMPQPNNPMMPQPDNPGAMPSQPMMPTTPGDGTQQPPMPIQQPARSPPAQSIPQPTQPIPIQHRPVSSTSIVYESSRDMVQSQLPMCGKVSFVHEEVVKSGICGSVPPNAYKVKISGAHFPGACGKCVQLDVGGGMTVKAHVVDQCDSCVGDEMQCGDTLGQHFFHSTSAEDLDKVNWNLCECD